MLVYVLMWVFGCVGVSVRQKERLGEVACMGVGECVGMYGCVCL